LLIGSSCMIKIGTENIIPRN